MNKLSDLSPRDLPEGTVTFLFTDIEGSTQLLHRLGNQYMTLLADHHRLLREVFAKWHGIQVDTEGDAFFVSFPRATEAVAAVVEAQRVLAEHSWPDGIEVRVRMGLHTGEPWTADEGYVGMDVHRAARIAHVGHGGQVLLSETTAALVRGELPEGVTLLDLGRHRLKDMQFPEHIRQLVVQGLPAEFPPLKTLEVLAPESGLEAEPVRIPAFLQDREIDRQAPIFVGREVEMERLDHYLDQSLQSQGQVIFLTGDAGSGKTALLDAFARQAQEKAPELLIAKGSCNALTGAGDPYLPFRTILRALTGDVEAQWETGTSTGAQARNLWQALPLVARFIVEHGPDLVDTFVPGAGLISRTTTAVPADGALLKQLQEVAEREKPVLGELEQLQLFQQYTEVLRQVAKEQPILVTLDDLQWADSGSINLLFHLGRALSGTRILVLAAYRPEEVALGRAGSRHPLAPVLDEFKRSFGDIWIDLNQSQGESFVQEFVDGEPNHLDVEFRRMLFQHTGGHALFTVELLRDLQERGDLVRDTDDYWIASPSLAWETLPARVEGVIEARIGRLEEELRDILTVAAVEGEEFTAQVVARVQQLQERRLLRSLSQELAKRHQLVKKRQGIHIGERLLSRYRFAHSLFQRYLYNDLNPGERRLLHGEIAAILEELYAGNLDDILAQLAVHYAEAGEETKAIGYFLKAGDEARARYAQQEAIDHYERALTFLRKRSQHEQTARTLMKMGLTLHSAIRFQEAQEAFAESFRQTQLFAATMLPQTIDPPSHALRIANRYSEPLLQDHTRRTFESALYDNVFSGLVQRGSELEIVPDGAASWEISSDGLVYTFHLRENILWSDGVPVKAADYVLSVRRMIEPDAPDLLARFFYGIRLAQAFHQGEIADPGQVGIYALDHKTLVIELVEPQAHFLQLLFKYYPIPGHILSEVGDAWIDSRHLVSNGPFRLDTSASAGPVVLIRNQNYHGPVRGNIEQVVVHQVRDAEESAAEMYEAGELDVLQLSSMPAGVRAHLRQKYADEYFRFPALDTIYLAFNVLSFPLEDPKIRQAFALATDREALSQIVLKGIAAQAMGGFIPFGMPGHNPGIAWPYDPTAAQTLLAGAGYPGGRDFPKLFVGCPGNMLFRSIFAFCQQAWREILNVDVTFIDPNTASDSAVESDLLLHGWIADYPDPHNFLVDFSVDEWTNWRNDEFERLLERAQKASDPLERVRLYSQADRMLVEESVILPLCYRVRSQLIKPWVSNYQLNALAQFRLQDVILHPHEVIAG